MKKDRFVLDDLGQPPSKVGRCDDRQSSSLVEFFWNLLEFSFDCRCVRELAVKLVSRIELSVERSPQPKLLGDDTVGNYMYVNEFIEATIVI